MRHDDDSGLGGMREYAVAALALPRCPSVALQALDDFPATHIVYFTQRHGSVRRRGRFSIGSPDCPACSVLSEERIERPRARSRAPLLPGRAVEEEARTQPEGGRQAGVLASVTEELMPFGFTGRSRTPGAYPKAEADSKYPR